MKASYGRHARGRTTFERARAVPVLGLVLAVIAMMLVPVAVANAAPGDFAWGVVRADANKSGALDGGPMGEADQGLAGVKVEIVDAGAGYSVVAEATTGADGSWAIPAAPDGVGPLEVRMSTADANGDVYAFYPGAASGDNDVTRGSAPNLGEAAIPVDGEINALVYPVWKLDAKLADDPNGVGGKSILTGAPTFDADDAEPGHDSGTTNTRVRSADIVAFNWSLTAESEDGSLGSSFENAVFEQTIHLVDGAVANFAGIPAICEAGSQIVAQPSGTVIAAKTDPPAGTTSVTLSCVLGEMGVAPAPSAVILSTLVQPSAKSPNGSSFETSSRFYGVDSAGAATAQPAPGPDVPPIDITAAPRYDVEKHPGGSNYIGSMTIGGESVTGLWTYYNIQISTDRKVGVEAFQQPISIEESFWATRTVVGPNGEPIGSPITDLKWYMDLCQATPASTSQGLNLGTTVFGKIGAPGSIATAANSVRDSGTCAMSRNGDPDTGNYTLTFDGIDTSGLTYPTQYVGGQSLAAGPFYVASYRIRVFIPLTEIDRMQGPADDGVGELSAFNRVGGFDPDGVSGASNFGSGLEPGYCDAGPSSDQAVNCDVMDDGTRSNNVAGPLTVRMAPGNWGKYFYDNRNAWSVSVTTLPSSAGTGFGDGQVQPGQAFTQIQTLSNTAVDWTSVQMCDVFDSTMLKLVPLDADTTINGTWGDGLYSAVLKDGAGVAANQADQANWVVKYGHIDLTGDDPNTGVFDVATDRYEGNWTQQRAATNGANTACNTITDWSDTPQDDTNVVWVSSADGVVTTSGTILRWYLAFEQRDEYYGGPHAGAKIPAGTVAANFGAVKTSGYNPNWSAATYIPGAGYTEPLPNNADQRHPGENASAQGDRWTVVRAQMRLQKQTVAGEVDGEAASGVAGFGITGAAVAGKPVIWEITSTLTASTDPAAPVNNVTITDTLPAYVVYSEAGTQALATAEGFPMPTSVTPNGDGTTTLVWNLGQRTPNQDLPLLKIATHTDAMAPPNTTAVNVARIAADGIVPVAAHTDDHTIRIEQSGQVQLKKSVDRTLDLQNDNQQYLLEVKNFSETLAIQAPTIYDVLPYNGDATNAANVNRTPASDFAGSQRLHAASVATDFDGTTPRAGTFYYTTMPGAQVPQRQQDDTDPSIWSTTFTPDATGFKFVSATPLTTTVDASASGIKITFQTDQGWRADAPGTEHNGAGDIYTNRFTATSPTLNGGNQLLTSNTVSVRVVGFSVGDFIWIDLDADGKYTEGVDRPAPAGVEVRVLCNCGDDTGPAITATTYTDENGRWIVNDLAQGNYGIAIPSSVFREGGLLYGYLPAPNAVPAGNEANSLPDLNESIDHHTAWSSAWTYDAYKDGVHVLGGITLSADTAADPITGDEPLGDAVAGLTPSTTPLTTDDFTNFTFDMALIPPAEFTVAKALDGEGAQYQAETEFTIEVTCTYGVDEDGAPFTVAGFPKTVTLTGGESETFSAPTGSLCTATETDSGGADEVEIDPANGVTLTFEPENPTTITVTNTFKLVEFLVKKNVYGNGAELHTDDDFTIVVDCKVGGSSWTAGGYPQTITLKGNLQGEQVDGADDWSQAFVAPAGAECSVDEAVSGSNGATSIGYWAVGPDTDTNEVALAAGDTADTVQLVVKNTFEVGSFEIEKQATGVGVGIEAEYTFEFTAICTYRGEEVLNENVILSGDGTTNLVSDEFGDLPVGSECVITEIDNGGADATPSAVLLTIDDDHETVQTAGFVNEYSAGEVSVLKELDGDSAEDEFLAGLQYEVWITCAIQDGDSFLVFFDSAVWLTPGEKLVLDVDGDPLLLPIGAHCWIEEETVDQGAEGVELSHDGYDNALVVEAGQPDEVQELALTVKNAFDRASLTVSKTVVGPGAGEFTFELQCFYAIDAGDGEEVVAYPLAAEDAAFTLRHGESRTIEVLDGVDCEVVETNVPGNATVTILDSDDSTEGGDSDGAVSSLTGTENSVAFTNTFPPLPETGAHLSTGLLWAGAGALLLLGGALVVRRRARA